MKRPKWVIEGYKDGRLLYKSYATDDLTLLQLQIFFPPLQGGLR